MAIKIVVNVSKKIPGPQEYSSIQASCSIESEISSGQDPVSEASRLYGSAERAVDTQLHLGSSNDRPQSPAPKRASTPITSSQLALLKRMIGSKAEVRQNILTKYGVQAVQDLSIREASEAIDSLKVQR